MLENGLASSGLTREQIDEIVEDFSKLSPEDFADASHNNKFVAQYISLYDAVSELPKFIYNSKPADFTKRAVLAERDGSYKISVGNLETRRAIMDQRDLVCALTLLAQKGTAGEVYNISSESIYRMRDIIKMIESYLGHKLDCEVDKKLLRPTDEKIIVGDITKLREATGWKQKVPMQQTVEDMMDYWRKKL